MSDPSSTFFPAKPRVARKRTLVSSSSPVVMPLNLVLATYDVTAFVELTFDRAIDVSAMDVGALIVNDGPTGFRYQGFDAPVLIAPEMVRVLVTGIEEIEGPSVTMTVGAANGIVAVDDAGTWAGVTDLELPFP